MAWTSKQISYQKFLSTPKSLRKEFFNVNTKKEFIENELGVTRKTAWTWTKKPGWVEEVNKYALGHVQEKIGDLYEAIFDEAIVNRKPHAMRLAVDLATNTLNTLKIESDDIDIRSTRLENVMDELITKLNKIADREGETRIDKDSLYGAVTNIE